MKSLLPVIFFFIFTFNSAYAEKAIIRSIENVDLDYNYVEVSEEGLPRDHYLLLLEKMSEFGFHTPPESYINATFDLLTKDSRARMRVAGGACSTRRTYIQNYLKKRNIVSGKLLVHCPAFNGRLKLKDQVTGHVYSFANFHDTNIVGVKSAGGPDFRVLDLQFMERPVSLQEYLSVIEANQKIRPKKNGNSRGYCTWSITTPYLSL